MAERHPIRMGLEAALICTLVGVLAYRYVAKPGDAADQGPAAEESSRMESFARERAAKAKKAAEAKARAEAIALRESDAELDLVPTDDEEEPVAEEGAVVVRVLDAAGRLVTGSYILFSPDLGYTNSVSQATLRFDVLPGVYRFGAMQEWDGVVLDAGLQNVRVTEGQAVAVTLTLEPPAVVEGGIGVVLRKSGDWFEVAALGARSPAARAGVRQGDVFIEIDGVSADQLDVPTAQELLRGPLDEVVNVVLALPEGDGWKAAPVDVGREADRP